MIFPSVKNKSGKDRAPRIAFYRISSAGIMAVAMLTAGCETIERVKEAVIPDSTPAKNAPVTEAAPAKKAQVTEAGAAKKAPSHSESPGAAPNRAAAQTALSEGIGLYDIGDFNGAIKRLNSAEISSSDKSTQTRALKYMAFSYCVTSRQILCRRQFERALKIDPAFDLEPGEKGHPLWSVAFDRAKKRK